MLDELGIKYGTDKSSVHHNFLKVYEQYLSPFRDDNVYLFELGYGGYQYEDRGGESAKTWYNYFPNAKIVCLDLYNKVGAINDRTEFWQGSQVDENLLQSIIYRGNGYSKRIITDDASHQNQLTIETFKIIFPLLKGGDLYFIEDTHTSYWDLYGFGGNANPYQQDWATTMGYFTELTHQLNAEHFSELYRNDFADKIEFIHFYKEMIVIKRL